MQWLFQVTLSVMYFAACANCLALRNYSQSSFNNQKVYPPGYNLYEAANNIYNRRRNKLHNRDLFAKIPADGLKRTYGDSFKKENSASYNKGGMKRGVDVGIRVNLPPTNKYDSNLERLEDILAKALEERWTDGRFNNSDCPNCDEDEEGIPVKRIVKPAYECDEWNAKQRICILERNIGDTVTFYLSTGRTKGSRHPNITWRKEFHLQDSVERKEFIIRSENPPENIIIGRKGDELRVSPITETDVEYNAFSATLGTHSSMSKVYFMIRIVPIDLGFVYVGEIIELNLRNYVSLPTKSISFKWYMEKDGEHGTLPSNMKVSLTGGSIKISELRQEQEGILACSVYTNLHFLATKKRFLLKDLGKNNNVLQSSPNHTLIFKEVFPRGKRDPKKFGEFRRPFKELSRQRREKNIAEEIEAELFKPDRKSEALFNTNPIPPRSYDNNLELNRLQNHREEPEAPEDYQNRFQEISENEDEDNDDMPTTKQIDTSEEDEPEKDEKPVENESAQYIPQPTMEEPSPEIEADDEVVPTTNRYQLEEALVNKQSNQEITVNNIPEYKHPQLVPGHQKYRPLSSVIYENENVLQPNSKQLYQSKSHYADMQTKKIVPNQKDDYSEIILNIDRVTRPSQVTEDKISKLISFCSSDFECSESAICVKPDMKNSGFCKCLPGSNGVGIFCREEIWLSDSKFNMEELRNADYA